MGEWAPVLRSNFVGRDFAQSTAESAVDGRTGTACGPGSIGAVAKRLHGRRTTWGEITPETSEWRESVCRKSEAMKGKGTWGSGLLRLGVLVSMGLLAWVAYGGISGCYGGPDNAAS